MKRTAPLISSQLGIYAECVAHKGELCYNLPFIFEIDGSLDGERLRQAVMAMVHAHPAFFTRIELNNDGELMQTIDMDNETWTLELEEVSDIEAEKASFPQPFDLEGGRLFRFRLLRQGDRFYLLMDVHHIINDGSSFHNMLQEISAAYEGNSIEPETFSLMDMAYEEVELRKSPAFEEGKKWYARHFDCGDTCTELIPDLEESVPRDGMKSRVLQTRLEDIDAFCREKGVFKSTFFTTAYAFLLAKFVGDKEALFNTVHNGRSDKRLARTQGMFVKTLPVYLKFDEETTVLQLMQSCQELMTGCRMHEIYSYRDLMNDLQLRMATDFVWHGMLLSDDTMGGKPMKAEPIGVETHLSPFYLRAYILDGQVHLDVEYDADKYSDAFIDQIMESYEAVVEGFLSKEHLRDIAIATQSQLALFDSFNNTDELYDDTQNIVSLFREQVQKTPDNVAVVFNDKHFTYKELDELSDRIAAFVSLKGLGREDIVSVLIPRNEWMAIASMGILKAGCGYQPLDSSYPSERLNFMMKDAHVKLLIADEALRSIVSEYDGDVLLTQDIDSLPHATPEAMEPSPDDLFIMLYTSGTTGVPKGCQLTHRNLVCFCHMFKLHYDLGPQNNVAAYASYGFDANMMDMYPTLTSGATLHIIPEEIRLDLIALNDYFEQNHITHSFMTTQVGYQFATTIENHSLLHLTVGGEKLASLTPPASYTLHNCYGPTECTIFTNIYIVKEKLLNIPIGKAMDNVHLYVVDPQGHRLPVGASGELCISGPQVSRGYLNRPEKTAEVYVTNPYETDAKYARMYRSGDIVRYLPDGNIQFVGRRDGQVKIRGFRIELTEVEGIIRQFPGIENVTVQAFDEEGGGKFIAAYVVSDQKIDIEALNQFIMEEKPPYMVPAVTMQIDAIPLNQNQKVNKRALPKPEKKAAAVEGSNAPLNVLEQQIKEIVSEILGHEDFGITTVLGYVGLTSISAIKLAVQVNKRFNVALDAKSLVKSGSIQSIENVILSKLLHPDTSEVEGNADAETVTTTTCGLSHAQTGVYFDCMKNPLSTLYNIPMKIGFPADADTGRLAEAVRTLVKLHPQLTASFGNEGGNVVQTTHPDMEIDVPIAEMGEAELAVHKQDFVKPYNLKQAPLCRFEIVRTEKGVCLLSDMHHLVSDGGSYDLFIRQLCDLMEGNGVDAEKLSYAAFVNAEKEAEQTDSYAEAKQFFHDQLSQVDGVTELSSDLTNPHANGTVGCVSSPLDWLFIDEYCRMHGLTPAHLTLSAVYYVLSRFANTEDICITTISSGRSNLSIQDTVGMFVNTLALSAKIEHQTVSDFIRQTRDKFDATLLHESYPFAQIAADYGLSAEIMFAYQIGVINHYSVSGTELSVESMELNVPKFPIAFYIREEDGKPCVSVEYDDGRYSKGMMQEMADSVANVAKAFVEQPDAVLESVSLLDKAQTDLLDSFNKTAVPYDDTETIVSLFRKSVQAHPHDTSVVFMNRSYTYQEVDEISDRIAAFIASKGLGHEDVVSVLIPRCEWMAIASLGVLKAGCAYQPLDPSYPAERLNFMMQDAHAKMLIADRELRSIVNEYAGEVLLTQDIPKLSDKSLSLSAANPEIRPHDLFILLYTSGSTGTPKGCQWEHRNIVAFCHWYHRKFALTADCRVSAYASYGFDACQMDMYSALTCGAAVYIIPEDIRLNLPELSRYFEAQQITHAFMTTQIAYQFATTQQCGTLRYLLTGGEKLAALTPPDNYTLVNIYGPTETTICITTFDVKETLKDIPVGKALDNMQLYVVDKQGNRLPVGAAGELWVAGPQVSRGYLNRPEKTAETYIPNPFGPGTVYRTGDIVRFQPDGNVQFVGRRDGQVKIRGFRIELKEVEAVIRQFPDVKDVTVQAFDYENGGKYIAAYIVSDTQIDVPLLNQFIARQKPSYMVPAATMQIDAIPLNQNQKVNRKALPAPVITAEEREYVAPANDLEKLFCDIYASILAMDRVGASDNFFDLGGTSLMVTRVIIEADKAGHHLAYGDLFDHPTPRLLADLISGNAPAEIRESDPIADYDYTAIHEMLKSNTLDAFRAGDRQTLGNVLLTGATGFLGIHVLNELIHSDAASICCLVRGKDDEDAKKRLQTLLFYYFDSSYDREFSTGRLSVACGDVTTDFGASFARGSIQTVFNCAAIVKHFSKGTEIEDVNIGGAERCVQFCLQTGARLVHISTYSTAGLSVNGNPAPGTTQTEQLLYFGQFMDNAYINSKFMAERIILEAMVRQGLNAKVLRVGNLSPRSTDGEFQINFQTNSAMGRVRAFRILGSYPYENSDVPMEFSPINEVAASIVALSATPKACCLFHPYNNHFVHFGDVMKELSVIGPAPEQVEAEEFDCRLKAVKDDPQKAKFLSSLLAYQDMAHGQVSTMIPTDNTYTTQVLYRLGFRWSTTSWDYIDRFLTAIDGLGYFDESL